MKCHFVQIVSTILRLRGVLGTHVLASNSSVATLDIFATCRTCENACWGTSPNPVSSGPVGLNFGTKCPKAETPGNSAKLFPGRLKMWKVVSNIGVGHINILPLHQTRLKPLANRALFSSKCSHLRPALEMLPIAENTHNFPPIRTPRTRRSFRCLLRGRCFNMRDLFHHALIGTVRKVHK